ncbi:uncharacterized protein LOC131880975 isoform X2 [Tigriopus californicus]|nr:uncharacterized protein LOC131880975 isoform X2 [Tigriopus californicus]
MSDALEWWAANEMDRFFSFKGCKRGSKIAHCSQNVQDKRASTKKTKKVFHCSAKIIFNQAEVCQCEDANADGDWCHNAQFKILAYGCLAHSHPIEPRKLRLSEVEKRRVIQMLQSGLRSDVILDKFVPQSANSKPLTYDDVYRIRKACHRLGGTSEGRVSEVENVTALLAEPAFRSFNFGSKFEVMEFPADVTGKVVETSGHFLITWASAIMLDHFRAHPTIISIHGSAGTNSSKFVLISILIFDSNGEGCPILQALAENESQTVVSAALNVLKSLVPEACAKVTTILTDAHPTYINAWRELIHSDVVWSVVHWDGVKDGSKKRTQSASAGPEPILNNGQTNDLKETEQIMMVSIENEDPAQTETAQTSQILSVERFRRTVKQVFRAKMDVASACLGIKQVNKIFYGIETVVPEARLITKTSHTEKSDLLEQPNPRKRKRLAAQIQSVQVPSDIEAQEVSRFMDELAQMKEKVLRAETLLTSQNVDMDVKRDFMNALNSFPMKMVDVPDHPQTS